MGGRFQKTALRIILAGEYENYEQALIIADLKNTERKKESFMQNVCKELLKK